MKTKIIIEIILRGGMPSVTGLTFTDIEFKQIQESIESKKDELDRYLKFVIQPKIFNGH